MLFSSPIFLFAFLPVTLAGYYLLDRKFKNIFLLIMSLIFYAWGEPKFIFIMLISIMANWLFGLAVDKFRNNKRAAHGYLTLMVLWNVSIFFVYKYLNFTITNVNALFGTTFPLTKFVLPIGISFFTFQAMSYVIDVYRGNGAVQKNPLNVALYITFFPQLIAGPIVRYETVANEIKNRKETLDDFSLGIKRFIYGLSKKLILSNLAAAAADKAFELTDYSGVSAAMAWFCALCYSLQILFDFSGYSDMAIGLGLMFGFHFNENFNYPYCSASVSEFWRRWHISLGTWFRDYVYFPLGGSRVSSKGRLVFNLFVVWMLTGIWHGASWNYVAWGFFYFVLLTFEKLTGIPKKLAHTWQRVLYRIFTLLCVMFGWVVFRAPGLKMGLSYIRSMFCLNGNAFADTASLNLIGSYALVAVLGIIFCMPVAGFVRKKIPENPKAQLAAEVCTRAICLVLLVISCSFAVSSSYNPFIYFNF